MQFNLHNRHYFSIKQYLTHNHALKWGLIVGSCVLCVGTMFGMRGVGGYGGSFVGRSILCVGNVWGRGVGSYRGSFVGGCILCVGNVCGVKGVGCYGVHLLEGVYSLL
jgi:hypothetical protein